MIKDVEDLKELLLWAKEQKILKLKVGDVEVEFSAFAFMESDPTARLADSTQPPALIEATAEPDIAMKDDPDLFHSVL